MKKIFNKLFKKAELPADSSRITTETIAHHRERILAGGRRFKYPIQYARHKLVFNAIIISFVALILILVIGWWQLYPAQNTSEFIYRVTRVIPVPVASVDGQPVLYGDYLMKYRSSIYYLEQKERVNLKTEDGERRITYVKQKAMDDVVAESYAKKLASKLKLSVDDVEIEFYLKSQRQSNSGEVSLQAYESVIMDYFNWNLEEYRYLIKNELLRQKVAYQIDTSANDAVEKAKLVLSSDPTISLKSLADNLTSQTGIQVKYGTSGLVPKYNKDGGLAINASQMDKNIISNVVKPTTGDGYYFIKLLDINDSQVNYEYINIPLSKFSIDLKGVIDSGKVKKYISL